MKKFLFVLTLCALFVCLTGIDIKENLDSSKIEKKLSQKWSRYYDCESLCSNQLKNSTQTFSTKLFYGEKLNLLEPEFIASKVALFNYLFLKDSTDIQCELFETTIIRRLEPDSNTFAYKIEELKLLEQKTKICEDFFFTFSNNEFNKLSKFMAPEVFETTDSNYISKTFSQINEYYGELLEVNTLGFSQPKTKDVLGNQIPLFKIKFVLLLEKENINLTFFMNSNPEDNKIYGIN